MELKDYQQRTLKLLDKYLAEVNAAEEKKRKIAEAGIDIHFDVLGNAWQQLGSRMQYKSWQNGLKKDTPSVCFKVPTGGGKTLLATYAIELINLHYRGIPNGFVLWIVPSTQIYRQTISALRNREHPYRQILDRISGGKTLVLDKSERFTPAQAQDCLIVMLLMLPSANRRDKEALKVFQDSSGFDEFFPAEDNFEEQAKLLNEFPNLDFWGAKDQWQGITLKTSLGNTLRLLQPLVVLDEGHKAYSQVARDTIRTFNPSFVLELSATPHKESNILVAVSGKELNREEMIKLDLNVSNKASWKWQDTLLAGNEKIKQLEETARDYHANGGSYIRPICLIQVERTGKTQDTGRFVHANDAFRFLVEKCDVNPLTIAIKSAEDDGLEDIDLLSPNCRIQYIITKSALQEGWDCPFAYVLVILTNPESQTGITQLVGRVLRQPYAKKTHTPALDECYIFCHKKKAKGLLDAIRKGFEEEGLSDLQGWVRDSEPTKIDEVQYRSQYQRFSGKIYLPRFVIQENEAYRNISYEMDILGRIDWELIDLSEVKITLSSFDEEDRTSRVSLSEDRHRVIDETLVNAHRATLEVDPIFITLQISDLVPNPWVGYQLAKSTLNLFANEPPGRVAANLLLIIQSLKVTLAKQRDKLAAKVFTDLLAEKKLCFFIQAVSDYALPSTIRVQASSPKLIRDNNDPLQLSLFEFQSEDEFNETEKAVAIFLDKQGDLLWWYRQVVGVEAYKIQGWQKYSIYADFVAAQRSPNDHSDYNKVFVIETKGLHLKGNDDTQYKRDIFELCNKLGREFNWQTLGEEFGHKQIEFQIIFEDEWQAKLNDLFSGQ